jgi:hypothetical protein
MFRDGKNDEQRFVVLVVSGFNLYFKDIFNGNLIITLQNGFES